MIDMIGVGPFITIPLIISAAGGPQAMLGWICGAVLRALRRPGVGGTGRCHARGRRLVSVPEADLRPDSQAGDACSSFLFIWQLSFSAPLSIASGCIGLAHYAGYLWPGAGSDTLRRCLPPCHSALGTLELQRPVMTGNLSSPLAPASIVVLLFIAGSRRSANSPSCCGSAWPWRSRGSSSLGSHTSTPHAPSTFLPELSPSRPDSSLGWVPRCSSPPTITGATTTSASSVGR